MDELYFCALPSVVTLMLMAMLQQIHLQKATKQQSNFLQEATPIPKYRYHLSLPYNRLHRFTFVGMHDVLCYHLTRFTPDQIHRILPLLDLHEIHFQNRFQATAEEAFVVILIRLSYPIRY